MTSSIPSTTPLNTPKTIQTPSSLVDSSLVSYAMLLIFNGFNLAHFHWFFIYDLSHHWNYITHVCIYSKQLWFRSQVHPSFIFYTHQFSPVANTFLTLAPYPHGDNIDLVFVVPYANISDISQSFQHRIIFGKALHQIGRKICDSHHDFAVI